MEGILRSEGSHGKTFQQVKVVRKFIVTSEASHGKSF